MKNAAPYCTFSHQTSLANNKNNIQITSLPPAIQGVFKVKELNAMQTQCFRDVFESGDNLIVAAPTGSGKTLLFELAILRTYLQHHSKKPWKSVYIAPIKALCSERCADWTDRFGSLGIKCIECTSDFGNVPDGLDTSLYDRLKEAHVIITTPEKWDFVTRRRCQYLSITSLIDLVLIDEVHLLNSDKRGSTLEVVVARTKIGTLDSQAQNPVRFVAASATIPNIKDIAEWLGTAQPAISHEFDGGYRPVPIETHVVGYPKSEKTNGFIFEKTLNKNLAHIVKQYSGGRPTLVFCVTKKGCEDACASLLGDCNTYVTSTEQHQRLTEACREVNNKSLQIFLLKGIGFHHGSLNPTTRKIIEQLFLNENIKVLCCTSTLAQGVNFPAHLVVIKSTLGYRDGGYQEYDDLQILQMSGRAGRPQFDSKGVVVIMTDEQSKSKWRSMVTGKQEIESQLASSIPEHLNAEIALRTIPDIETALKWIKSTFFYIHVKNHPNKYKVPSNYPVDLHLQNTYINKGLRELQELGLITITAVGNRILLEPANLGLVMARHCVQMKTMERIIKLDKELIKKSSGCKKQILFNQIYAALLDELKKILLECVVSAGEFEKDLAPRMSERKALRELATNKLLLWPYKGAISTAAKKAFVLLQCSLSRVKVDNWQLQADQTQALRVAERISMCLQVVLQTLGYGNAYCMGLKLARSFRLKLWDDSHLECLQLNGIGDVIAQRLSENRLSRLDEIATASHDTLESTLGTRCGQTRVARWQHEAASIPRVACIGFLNKSTVAVIKIESTIFQQSNSLTDDSIKDEEKTIDTQKTFYNLVVYDDYGRLLSVKNFCAPLKSPLTLSFPLNNCNFITGELICEKWIGLDTMFEFKNPSNFSNLEQENPRLQNFGSAAIPSNFSNSPAQSTVEENIQRLSNTSILKSDSCNIQEFTQSENCSTMSQPHNKDLLGQTQKCMRSRIELPNIKSQEHRNYARPTELILKVVPASRDNIREQQISDEAKMRKRPTSDSRCMEETTSKRLHEESIKKVSEEGFQEKRVRLVDELIESMGLEF